MSWWSRLTNIARVPRLIAATLVLVSALILHHEARPGGQAGTPTSPSPNVIIIYADDLGYADIGPFSARKGAQRPRTPNLDRMAAEGIRLTDFYVAQAVCSASRAALLTGSYSNRVGITGALNPSSKQGISADEHTMAEVL
jgi:arylsulfatase